MLLAHTPSCVYGGNYLHTSEFEFQKKMRKVIFYFFIFLCCNAQNTKISGVVLDHISREPITFANISILGESIGSVTDSLGKFEIKN